MLKRLSLQSVKSFLTEGVVQFAPITLIAGTNSSGKSTIFQTLLLLKQAFDHPALSYDGMHLNGPQASVGAYSDWCSKHGQTETLVAIEITNGPLIGRIRQARSSLSQRRAAPPVLWWGNARRNRFDTVLSGVLRLTFTPSIDSPNDTRLKRVSWEATATRGEESSGYTLFVEPAAPTEEELDAAEIDSDSDTERYRYSMKTTRTWSGAAVAPTTTGPEFCAVEGLLPTSVLSATEESAATATVVELMASVITWTCSGLNVPDSGDPKKGLVDIKYIMDILNNPTKHRFSTLASRAKKANSTQAAHLLGALSEVRFARMFVDGLIPVWTPKIRLTDELMAAQQEAIDELLAMALRLVEARAHNRAEPFSAIEDLRLCAARVIKQEPKLDAPIRFLLEVAEMSDQTALRDEIIAGLQMAERHSSVSRHQLIPRTVDNSIRALRALDGAQVVAAAPHEVAVRRFFVEGLFHLGPLRDEPRVLYVADVPFAPHDVGKRGQRAVSCLREFGGRMIDFPLPPARVEGQISFENHTMQLSEAVSHWGQYLGVFDALHIDTSEKYGTVVKVQGVMDGVGISPDLTNVGVGVSQVLPILVLCAAMPVGGAALVEQPELHLHPSVQSKLAVFFAACAASGRQVVLESHSEHLVNRIRLLVALDEVSSSDVSLVFVERDEYGATIAPLKIEPDGSLERWPRGFMDEAEIVLGALMRARKGQRP